MARKHLQRVSYELPMPDGPGGHRLGVNGLAIDAGRSILYSAGRDGVICSWDLHLDPRSRDPSPSRSLSSSLGEGSQRPESRSSTSSAQQTAFRRQVQAHTHWINDITLAQSNTVLVSGSSDTTVRVWRQDSEDSNIPSSIGRHRDYVKCLASPRHHADWVASGGLDHKICVWDLNGGGEKLKIDVSEDGKAQKGSVYALGAKGSILVSGGPDGVVRVWDSNSGKLANNFMGHTDNVRGILVNDDANTIITASSDQTVKVWSITAGRCMHTLTMHNESVWSLYSDHPQLSVFYSSDRAGVVAKTDTRNAADMDQGVCVAALQENEGVFKVVAANDHIWTATPKCSINRWSDVDTTDIDFIPSQQLYHHTSNVATQRESTKTAKIKISRSSILALSDTSQTPQSEEACIPAQTQPKETLEGKNGLVKHMMLNDRTRALTKDTAGEVVLWDLIRCVAIQSFGKGHLDDIAAKLNTTRTIANWCTLHIRTGTLSVILEPHRCFDGEMYADESDLPDLSQFREDQRINLGKWVLCYLFAGLVDEEIRRDAEYRTSLEAKMQDSKSTSGPEAPNFIDIPPITIQNAESENSPRSPAMAAQSLGELHSTSISPGMSIGVATPAPLSTSTPENPFSSLADSSGDDHNGKRIDRPGADGYFVSKLSTSSVDSSASNAKTPAAGETTLPGPSPTSPVGPEKEEKAKRSGSLFGKKFQMSFPKKLGRTSTEAKPVVEEKTEESDGSSEKEKEKVPDLTFRGVIDEMRASYETALAAEPEQKLQSKITPIPENETPVISIPPNTPIIIQEDGPGIPVAPDIYRGTVTTISRDTDELEKVAPAWLGRLLLENRMEGDTVKITFSVKPYKNLLPEAIDPSSTNSRLSANRMLRAKKILAYVAERIDPQYSADNSDENYMKPEDYLELYCQNTLIPPDMTLLTMRTHVWRTGNDMVLYYKANGKRIIPFHQKDDSQTCATNGSTAVAAAGEDNDGQNQPQQENGKSTESTGMLPAANSNSGAKKDGTAGISTGGSTPASHSRTGSSTELLA
ncbi:hypothetical protein D8B26_007595 [Coccidioides posadasii str. Silveira]|uniref:WD repeat protein n=1 Tax=Coccidioides posadasii (strain RMSCC 757 / Silveira) TaxID=443226 RepID=E9D2E2_COCPS|nr:WD repeat protein [Coccidioides posadasii str. Silveira]QVM12979.1 hypothetical protein D8B26_007595 [Coccidioides posadasii str. Silveira]